METPDTVPVFAQRGVELPVNTMFSTLRDFWLEDADGRTSSELAELLDTAARERGGTGRVLPQNVSQWATGSDDRKPPSWVLMRLCSWTNSRIVLTPSAVSIEPVQP